MSLQRLGGNRDFQAIMKRIREIQADIKAHPEEYARRDAEIDADRARLKAQSNGATHAHSSPPPGKFSRESMRAGGGREDGDLV